MRANDGAATHERRGVTPATSPLFGPDSRRLWEQTLCHGGLLHLQRQIHRPFMHMCHTNKQLQSTTASDLTFTIESLLDVCSQRPPVVMQMPSAHRPSEQAAVKAVLLLQPLSTDSACQLLQKYTPDTETQCWQQKEVHFYPGHDRTWFKHKLLPPLRGRLPRLILLLQPLQLQLCLPLLQMGGGSGGGACQQRAYSILLRHRANYQTPALECQQFSSLP